MRDSIIKRTNKSYCLGISNNIELAKAIEKGDKKIEVMNAQELPKKGKLIIKGFLFYREVLDFIRDENILYIKEPIKHNFSVHSTFEIPKIYINTHVTPGMSFLELTDYDSIPSSGLLQLQPSSRHEEKIEYQHLPNTLWLDNPPGKRL